MQACLKQLLLTFKSQRFRNLCIKAEMSPANTNFSSPQLCWFGCASLAQLQSDFKCSLSTQMCTTSSSAICQLWQHYVSPAQMQTLSLGCKPCNRPEPISYAATCHLTHKLSAQLYYINSSAVCQPIYIVSSSVLCQLQVESVSSSTVCLLSCNLSAQLTFKFQLNCQLTC